MLRTRRGLCQHIALFFVKTALYESRLLGLLPFTFDSRRKQLKRCLWFLLYGIIFNLFTLCIFLFSHFEAKNSRNFDAFKRNPLLRQIFEKSKIITFISASTIHFINFLRSNKIQEIANELLTLEYRHFKGLDLKNCHKFKYFVIQKSIIMLCQIIILFMNTSEHEHFRKTFPLTLVILCCVPIMAVHLIVFHFYMAIISIYRYVWLINDQLHDLANNMKLNSSVKTSRIRELMTLYERLLQVIKKVEEAYDFQMTLMIANYLLYIIVISYFHIVIGISLKHTYIFLVYFPKLAIHIWDFWLNIVVCDLAEKASLKTSTLLKLFANLEHKDAELEKNLNQFAWLCSHRKFRIKLCGLFFINYRMGFHLINTTFLYLLYLAQFDYMNL